MDFYIKIRMIGHKLEYKYSTFLKVEQEATSKVAVHLVLHIPFADLRPMLFKLMSFTLEPPQCATLPVLHPHEDLFVLILKYILTMAG